MPNPSKIRGVSKDPDVSPHPRTYLDDLLWERVVRGDPAAFDAIYDQLAPPVYGVCLRVLRDPALAQEAAQEALLHVWRQAPQVDLHFGSVLAWACTIAHRRAVDSVRANESRKRREAALRNDPACRDALAAASEMLASDGGQSSEVEAALQTLSGAQRQAIELAYYHGLTYRQVARSLGIPEGTAKARIRRGLLQLRRAMTPPNAEQNRMPSSAAIWSAGGEVGRANG